MKMLVLQHNEVEGPAMIADWADDHDYDIEILRPDLGVNIAKIRPDQFDLLVIMGGGNSAEDTLDWLADERDLIHRAHNAHKPIFGVCLGAQQIALAFGALVDNLITTEIGWMPVQSTNSSIELPDELNVLHWHNQQFTIPADGVRLFKDDLDRNQGFMLGDNIIGLQFHFEIGQDDLNRLIDFDRDFIDATDAPNEVQQTAEQISNGKGSDENRAVLYQLLDSITK
ncbi:type 1 glutamine amidotransferase [Nicoliella lavandulae]|uniref:Type 1 glutamine amidotransferase n=1 Tax=Nicoliella lavandulae TaxID=3082954 RepID=A0ABU8SJL4_9LACO